MMYQQLIHMLVSMVHVTV